MSSRAISALVLLAGGLFGLANAIAGCSDEEPTSAADAGIEAAGPDANRPAPPDVDVPSLTCEERCREAHPAGVAKDEAVSSCWDTHCTGPCIEQLPGDGGTDGAAPDGGTCVSPVVTVSAACDECTNTFCCTEWDVCFQEPECAALNACYQQCTE